jgi:hypothetical protein
MSIEVVRDGGDGETCDSENHRPGDTVGADVRIEIGAEFHYVCEACAHDLFHKLAEALP